MRVCCSARPVRMNRRVPTHPSSHDPSGPAACVLPAVPCRGREHAGHPGHPGPALLMKTSGRLALSRAGPCQAASICLPGNARASRDQSNRGRPKRSARPVPRSRRAIDHRRAGGHTCGDAARGEIRGVRGGPSLEIAVSTPSEARLMETPLEAPWIGSRGISTVRTRDEPENEWSPYVVVESIDEGEEVEKTLPPR